VRVAVIGGGLAGLSAALEFADAGSDVVLLEAGDRYGGQIRTTRDRGFLIEEGADGFGPDEAPTLMEWVRELRLAEEVIDAPPIAPQATLRGGMASIVLAMVRRLERRADLRIGNAAVAVTRTRPGWTVYPELGAALVVDAVVLALPPRPAAWLVHPLSHDAAAVLGKLTTRPLVTITAAYPRPTVAHPLAAAGFAVPRSSTDDGVVHCVFTSALFPGRAPDGWVLLRTVVRPARGELINTTDEGWAESVHQALSPVLGINELPAGVWVARWSDAVPLSSDHYATRVAEARTVLRTLGRLELAGAPFEGHGIDGALNSGRSAARRVLGS
jgi:oxygen-dependent protoporphyrinogen oxidase